MNPTNDILHTKVCNERQTAAKAYEEKWPKFCRSCGGSGAWYEHGTREHPPDGGPCACVEAGVCPRCAVELILIEKTDADWSLCKSCGWDEEKIVNHQEVQADTYPEVDCYCEMEGADDEAAL